jgi:hypothetical protein
MSLKRQPRGTPDGGRFAAGPKPEARFFIGGSQVMKPVQGQLARSLDDSISAAEASDLWTQAKGRINVQDGAYEQMAFNAGQNLAQNPATPPEILHDMVVKRDKDGTQITRAWFMDKLPMQDPLRAVINHPNTSAETLFVIARSSGHQPQSDAARLRLKSMRRGASIRAMLELFAARRKASATTRKPGTS